jgi:cyanophycinase
MIALSLGAVLACAEDGNDRDLDIAEESGALLIAGGGPHAGTIDERFLALQRGEKKHVVVLSTASPRAGDPNYGSSYFWRQTPEGVIVDLLHTRSVNVANDPEFCSRLDGATGVWIAGGNQEYLEFLRGTLVHEKFKKILASGGVIAGTSAGAAAMGDVMIRKGNPRPELGRGFGFIHPIIDQHFTPRNRAPRLLTAMEGNPERPGVGIDESTAIVVRCTNAEVIGAGNVHFFPSHSSKLPSLVLSEGDTIDLQSGVVERKRDAAVTR